MKVLRIIARLNVGGPARHVVWLSEGLTSDGYETTLVAGVVPPGEDDMGYLATEAGVVPLTIPEMSREISPKDALTVWKLYRLMRRERPDLVHTHTAKAGTVGRVAGLMYRWLTPSALIGKPRQCRFVHTYHGHVFHSYYGGGKTRLFLGIERWLARLATDRIVVISDQQRSEINERFRVGRSGQFAVIPLGIDLGIYRDWENRRAAFRKELGIGTDEVLIGIVGRVTEIKNLRLFMDAAASLQATEPKARFVVIGDGALRADLETYAATVGLKDRISFTGTRNDPENFYPALDIVALTSLNEGTPLSLIEGMANARAIVATAVGGVVDLLGPEVLTGAQPSRLLHSGDQQFKICERGVSVPSGNAAAFAAALRHLIDHAQLRHDLGLRGLRFVEQNYAKERLLRDMSRLYAELLAGADPTAKRELAVD